MPTTEQRIVALEQDNKARKASYPIAGSMVDFKSQYSPTYSKSGNGTNVPARIKFQADSQGTDSRTLVTLEPQVSFNSDFSTSYPLVFSINEPQSGDGSVILSIIVATPYTTDPFYFRALAIGASEGTFTLL